MEPQPPQPSKPDAAESARRAAKLQQEMSRAPIGSKERRFLRRAAERARKRAEAERRAVD